VDCFKNFIKPFGEPSRAVHIADTFDFFLFGLTGGVDVILKVNVCLIAADVPSINILLREEVRLGPGEGVHDGNEVDGTDSCEGIEDISCIA
jgi:hypothetical protein